MLYVHCKDWNKLSSVALTPKHGKSNIEIQQKKHSNPNKSKWKEKNKSPLLSNFRILKEII